MDGWALVIALIGAVVIGYYSVSLAVSLAS
jgi:hypothetical protein